MAKKKAKKKEVVKAVEPELPMQEIPPVEEGFIDVQLTEDELRAITGLLSSTQETYTRLAEEALANKNAQDVMTYAAKARVYEHLAYRLLATVEVGEPTNRNVH